MTMSNLPPDPYPHGGPISEDRMSVRSQLDRRLLTLVRRHGALAKSELARLAGLSPQTVSVATRALEDEGLLQRLAPVRGRIGQPMIPLALAPNGAYVAGAKIGRRSVEYLLADFRGGVLSHTSLRYSAPDPTLVLPWLRAQLRQTRDTLGPAASRLSGLGIAMPCLLWDWPSDTPSNQRHLQAWNSTDPSAELADEGLPIILVNDATAACVAEMMFGDATFSSDTVYFYIGTFIGGGIVQNGRLWTGPTGQGGALGSILVQGDHQKPVQLIKVASLSVLEQSVMDAGAECPDLTEDGQDWTPVMQYATPWIERAAQALAQASVTAAAITRCRTIVIDGAIPDTMRQALVERTRHHMSMLDMSGIASVSVGPGTRGILARTLGAAGMPLIEEFGLSIEIG
ncbi:MAG: ROK family protein [Paracoccus hibiscisoli]|uniref:ROK family transcriptional regulator n=1 Tax=Paracoccus hibiscisoli TaxID=2023261 RepID=UPI00391A8222